MITQKTTVVELARILKSMGVKVRASCQGRRPTTLVEAMDEAIRNKRGA